MIKNILFDFDGTVFDTVDGITKCAQYALSLQGIEEPAENLRCFAGPPLVDMFMEHNGFTKERAEQATRDFKSRYAVHGVNECCVFPGIYEVVEALREAGRTVGIATSKPQHLAEMLLEREGMTDLFEVLCGSLSTGNNNSKAEVLKRAMDEIGAVPENTVLVGDTKWDILGAAECGVKCVGVRYGYAAPGELEDYGACAIAENMEDLKNILLNM